MATIGQAAVIRSGPDYGAWRSPGPYGVAVHCLQCPGNVNVASLAGPGSYTQNQGVSPHTMSDQRQIVEILGPDRSGAHVGSAGNPFLWGAEVVGYAEWTPEQWAENEAALRNQAKAIGRFWAYQGWSVTHLQWGSLAELVEARRRYSQGLPPAAPRLWIHWDVSRAIGGTNHWDVGRGYPYADMERWARESVTGTSTEELFTVGQYEAIMSRIDALDARIFNRAAGSQSLLDEIWFYGNTVILPRLAAILVEVSEFDVVIYRDGNQLWWSEAGQTNHIPDPDTLRDMIYVAEQTGKKIKYWDGNADARPGAFGARNPNTAIPGQRPPVTQS